MDSSNLNKLQESTKIHESTKIQESTKISESPKLNDLQQSTDSKIYKECPICYDTLDETQITLDCGHIFHYECILKTFLKDVRISRKCPYCRDDVDYLELRNNQYPIRGIHKEFNLIEQCIKNNNFNEIKKITKKFLCQNKCQAILKTGIKKGYQCGKAKKKNHDYCHLHLKDLSNN